MATILKKGSLTRTVTCKRCKSELSYEPSEIQVLIYEDCPTSYMIVCPLCREKLGQNWGYVNVPDPYRVER